MARLVFWCPQCGRTVAISDIRVAAVKDNTSPHWRCGKCGGSIPRDDWGRSTTGEDSQGVYVYEGPGKSEPFLQKLPRALLRERIFGAPADTRGTRPVTVDNRVGRFEPVAIYHERERYTLRGRFFIPAKGQGNKVVMLLSGSGGPASVYVPKLLERYLKRVEVPVLVMDYRGFGMSDEKTPSSQGLYTDAEAMFNFLSGHPGLGGKGYPPDRVVVHGYSLGTGIATELAKRRKDSLGGLILQCPWSSAADVARRDGSAALGAAAGNLAGKIVAHGSKMDIFTKIRGVTRPILLLVANQDERMKNMPMWIWHMHKRQGLLTLGTYDGTHLEPENAFKDGTHTFIITGEARGQVFTKQLAPGENPTIKGDFVLKDKSLPPSLANSKLYRGKGCIGTITNWFNSLP
jgi:pimeloyl-ACP methyl ester carboxylesterase